MLRPLTGFGGTVASERPFQPQRFAGYDSGPLEIVPADFDLDAAQLTGYSHDDTVSTFSDASGNDRHLLAAFGGDGVYNSAGLNSLPTVDVPSGGSLQMTHIDPAGRADSHFTVYIVMDRGTGITNDVFNIVHNYNYSPTNDAEYSYFDVNWTTDLLTYFEDNDASATLLQDDADGPMLIVATRSPDDITHQLSDLAVRTGTVTGTTPMADAFWDEITLFGVPGFSYARVFGYFRELTTEEHAQNRAYCAATYGLTL